MKHILAPILFLVLLFPSLAQGEEVSHDDLVWRDGLFYKKFTDVPFTGQVMGKKEQGSFKKGKREGPWVRYHDSGRIRDKGDFKNGTSDGPWVRYKRDGTVDEEITGTYKDGAKVD